MGMAMGARLGMVGWAGGRKAGHGRRKAGHGGWMCFRLRLSMVVAGIQGSDKRGFGDLESTFMGVAEMICGCSRNDLWL